MNQKKLPEVQINDQIPTKSDEISRIAVKGSIYTFSRPDLPTLVIVSAATLVHLIFESGRVNILVLFETLK